MNKYKYIIAIILVFGFLQYSFPARKVKSISMDDLTDPSSPSYVPVPFPKNRKEIITDLKYVIKKLFTHQTGTPELLGGPSSEARLHDRILTNLLEEKPVYKIGKILKVKNLIFSPPFDYSWLIFIKNEDNYIVSRVELSAAGLYRGDKVHPIEKEKVVEITENSVLQNLSRSIGKTVEKKHIKKIEHISLPPHIGTSFHPAWEMTLKDGNKYYFSEWNGGTCYRVKDEISWKERSEGIRPDLRKTVPRFSRVAFDYAGDRILVFEEARRVN